MAQLLLVAGNGNIPNNTDFFQPLAEPFILVPTLPGISFLFGHWGEHLVSYHDFYLFGIQRDILFNTSKKGTKANWEEIYQLEGMILAGTSTVQEVIPKQWPGNGSGPRVNYCMLAICKHGNSSQIEHPSYYTVM
ncbi:unnamed protein product [Dibothriocephalus latus]|uniref:Uncharacterized protein n=1 Tax=Dibothriocephalus latus TaxID=60516 RepID=A0A3P7MDK2_DIBLA|nr:unnamed protein product [Dibothriocephalus latus]